MRRALALAVALAAPPAGAGQLAGHGGPVMSIAALPEGVLTASFDTSLGLWHGATPRWLTGHDAAVNDVAAAGPGRAVSGGDDFAVLLWDLETGAPLRFEGHEGKVQAVAATADGTRLASASWDGTVRLWSAAGDPLAVLAGHDGAVNDVAFDPAGTTLWSAGFDGRVLEWDVRTDTQRRVLVRHGFGVNRLALDPAGRFLAYGALDGATRVLDLATGTEIADLSGERRPILALALSPGAERLAIGDGGGFITIVDTGTWSPTHDFRAAAHGPVWALAFTADGTGLLAGGIADEVAVWPLGPEPSEPLLAAAARPFHTDPAVVGNGERQFLRKCSVCHELGPDGARRAGPTLHRLFGRPAGSVAGYAYSDSLAASAIVWTEATVDRLFDLGPDQVTPGSKMPMQRIASPQDRADLIAFLRQNTHEE